MRLSSYRITFIDHDDGDKHKVIYLMMNDLKEAMVEFHTKFLNVTIIEQTPV
jgi:hypothetical protein